MYTSRQITDWDVSPSRLSRFFVNPYLLNGTGLNVRRWGERRVGKPRTRDQKGKQLERSEGPRVWTMVKRRMSENDGKNYSQI